VDVSGGGHATNALTGCPCLNERHATTCGQAVICGVVVYISKRERERIWKEESKNVKVYEE